MLPRSGRPAPNGRDHERPLFVESSFRGLPRPVATLRARRRRSIEPTAGAAPARCPSLRVRTRGRAPHADRRQPRGYAPAGRDLLREPNRCTPRLGQRKQDGTGEDSGVHREDQERAGIAQRCIEGDLVNTVKAICCLALLCGSAGTAPALAEATGQQRAHAAAQAILGAPAPRLRLETIDGESIDLGDLYGKKAVYLKFWATWCVPCRQQMPHFEHAYETAGPDMAVIAINVGFNDSVEAIRAYRKQLGITMPIVFDDGSLGAAFHLRVTPTHVVIGRDGRIQYVSHLADQELDAALVAARTAAQAPDARDAHGAAIAHNDPPPIGVGDLLPEQSLRTLDGQRFEFQHGAAQQKLTVLV